MKFRPVLLSLLSYPFLAFASPDPALDPLPVLKIDPERVTVSGVSSGAYFAVQFQVANSSLVKGVASVAGGSYWCAEGESSRARTACMLTSSQVNPGHGIEKARQEEAAGRIDPLKNLRKALIFHSAADHIIHPGHSDHLEAFFRAFLPGEKVKHITHPAAAHGFPTEDFGNPCERPGPPWINSCQLDLAGEILQFLDETPARQATPGKMLFFSQGPYQTAGNQIFRWGGLYIPLVCNGGLCGLHIAFHGCQMNSDFIQTRFMEKAGFQKWADRKAIVILFPQAADGNDNPYGCWDWFGFTDKANYINRNGPQIQAVRAMVRDLSGL